MNVAWVCYHYFSQQRAKIMYTQLGHCRNLNSSISVIREHRSSSINEKSQKIVAVNPRAFGRPSTVDDGRAGRRHRIHGHTGVCCPGDHRPEQQAHANGFNQATSTLCSLRGRPQRQGSPQPVDGRMGTSSTGWRTMYNRDDSNPIRLSELSAPE